MLNNLYAKNLHCDLKIVEILCCCFNIKEVIKFHNLGCKRSETAFGSK